MTKSGSRSISSSELKQHSSSSSCWIIIRKDVWDITSFVPSHPGGPDIILRYAGNDATAAYDEVHAPSVIKSTLSADKLVGHVTDETLASLPKEAAPKTSPDQSTDSYTKPSLDAIINTHDLEEVARKTVSPKAWAFYSSAATDLITHRLNTDIYSRILFRPRVLRPVSTVDTKSSVLGIPSALPIFVAPAAMARLAHPDGELALARGAKEAGIIQAISTNASYPLNEIVEAVSSKESPHPWFLQLYVNRDHKLTEKYLAQAVKLGVTAIFLTVDCPVAGKREADERMAHDKSVKTPTQDANSQKNSEAKGGGLARIMGRQIEADLKWDDIPWIARCLRAGQKADGQVTSRQIPIVIKGIQTAADARKALEYTNYGVRGVFLSNHGGRSLDTAPPAILTLLECWKVCPEIFKKLEVYVDGGIKRGTDVVKAIALGARAVGVGRPFLYSLTYGEEGVKKLVNSTYLKNNHCYSGLTAPVYQDEVEVTMQMLGVNTIDQLHPGLVTTRDIDHLVPDKDEDGDEELRHPYAGFRSARAKL